MTLRKVDCCVCGKPWLLEEGKTGLLNSLHCGSPKCRETVQRVVERIVRELVPEDPPRCEARLPNGERCTKPTGHHIPHVGSRDSQW